VIRIDIGIDIKFKFNSIETDPTLSLSLSLDPRNPLAPCNVRFDSWVLSKQQRDTDLPSVPEDLRSKTDLIWSSLASRNSLSLS
jgi:hypothetical protein